MTQLKTGRILKAIVKIVSIPAKINKGVTFTRKQLERPISMKLDEGIYPGTMENSPESVFCIYLSATGLEMNNMLSYLSMAKTFLILSSFGHYC